jgi:hypothetical protein
MPVALLPPLTRGCGRDRDALPLNSGPRYVRGPGNSRWHRARAGVRRPARTSWILWCGPFISDRPDAPAWQVDEVPAGHKVCGTCVGRALGAGQDDAPAGMPELVFEPRWLAPPRWCPGSRSHNLIGAPPQPAQGSVGVCLACGDLVAVRAMGPRWSPTAALIQHPPGTGLLAGCPFHGWQYIGLRRSGQAGCSCGWHDTPPPGGDA